MFKQINIVLTVLVVILLISNKETNGQISDSGSGSGDINIGIAQGGNAIANVNNTVLGGPISIEIEDNSSRKSRHHRYHWTN